jgi:para-nitrobenzyl esterase
MSEDMLSLNVYTPAADRARRPVLVYIHGGGYSAGSASDFDPSPFAARHDMVVVCMNYRLALFGFLDVSRFGDEYAMSASAGFLDQIAALRWIGDNIEDYGGDPGNVTLTGVSAGAGSVLALLGAPAASGFFHKAIAFSPAEIAPARFDTIGALAKARNTSENELFDQLCALDGAGLFEFQGASALGGLACVDGLVIRASVENALRARINPVPLLVGNCINEGAMLTPAIEALPGYDLNQVIDDHAKVISAGNSQRYLEFLDKQTSGASIHGRLTRMWYDYFRAPVLRAAAAGDEAGVAVYVYSFEVPTDHPYGPTHSSDMVFSYNLFDACSVGEGEMFAFHRNTSENRAIAHQWSDAIARFARTGDPNGERFPHWPTYSASVRNSLVLRDRPIVVSAMDSAEALDAYGAA